MRLRASKEDHIATHPIFSVVAPRKARKRQNAKRKPNRVVMKLFFDSFTN